MDTAQKLYMILQESIKVNAIFMKKIVFSVVV